MTGASLTTCDFHELLFHLTAEIGDIIRSDVSRFSGNSNVFLLFSSPDHDSSELKCLGPCKLNWKCQMHSYFLVHLGPFIE